MCYMIFLILIYFNFTHNNVSVDIISDEDAEVGCFIHVGHSRSGASLDSKRLL